MNIELKEIGKSQLNGLLNLYQFYIYDMTEFYPKEIDDVGHYSIRKDDFEKYWNSEGHYPYFIYVDGSVAGFCLLREIEASSNAFDVEQFFVLKMYRRKNIGCQAFRSLLSMHRGQWQVRVLLSNEKALSFWRSCIEQFTKGSYQEDSINESDLVMQRLRFEN